MKAKAYKITHDGSSYHAWHPIDADYANEIAFEGGGWSCEYAGEVDVSRVRAEMWRRYALEGVNVTMQAMTAPRCLQPLFHALVLRPNPTAEVITAHASLEDLLRHELVQIDNTTSA
jgi:hypothetical protein